MPAATAPLGKPSAAAKPSTATTGFTKPAGLSRQTAAAKEEDDAEPAAPQPILLGASILVLLLAALFAYAAYTGDQVPNRVSDYLFGAPDALSDDGGSSGYDSSDDDGYSSSASDDEDDEDDE